MAVYAVTRILWSVRVVLVSNVRSSLVLVLLLLADQLLLQLFQLVLLLRNLLVHLGDVLNHGGLFFLLLLNFRCFFRGLLVKPLDVSAGHLLKPSELRQVILLNCIKAAFDEVVSLFSRGHLVLGQNFLPLFLVKVVKCTVWVSDDDCFKLLYLLVNLLLLIRQQGQLLACVHDALLARRYQSLLLRFDLRLVGDSTCNRLARYLGSQALQRLQVSDPASGHVGFKCLFQLSHFLLSLFNFSSNRVGHRLLALHLDIEPKSVDFLHDLVRLLL